MKFKNRKRIGNRLLSILLTILLVLTLFPATALADEPNEILCEVVDGGQYETLSEALNEVPDGGTIRLLQNILCGEPVIITGKDITFDLNGNQFTIDTSHITDSEALRVVNCTVGLLPSGGSQFTVKGALYGVFADHNASVTVQYAEATGAGGTGAYAQNGGTVTVLGDAKGRSSGAIAKGDGSEVTVNDDAMSTDDNSIAIYAAFGGYVRAKNAISSGADSTGIWASGTAPGTAVAVTGSVSAGKQGVYVSGVNAVTVTVGGNVTSASAGSEGIVAGGSPDTRVEVKGYTMAGGTGVYANGCEVTVVGGVASSGLGVYTLNGGRAIIGGTINATPYIKTGTTEKVETDKESSTTKPGYDTYTDGTSTVWVKASAGTPNVCAIGGTEYPTLEDALNAAPVGQSRTIRLLQDITFSETLVVNNKTIVFDLGAFDLTVNNAGTGTGHGLDVLENGSVSYTDKSLGRFSVTGTLYGVYIENSQAAVSSATATDANGYALYMEGAASSAVVNGNVQALTGVGVYMEDGEAVVNGNVSSSQQGVDCLGGKAAISGNVTVTSDHGYAVGTLGDAEATVGGNVTTTGADAIGVRASDRSKITVNGRVAASGADSVGVSSMYTNETQYSLVTVYNGVAAAACAVQAESYGRAVIFGPVSATGENGVGVQAFGRGQVTVTGNVTAPDSGTGVLVGMDKPGREIGPGKATITGNVTAGHGLNAEDGGNIRVNGNLTAKSYGIQSRSGGIYVTGNVTSENSYGVTVQQSADVTIDGIIDALSYIDISSSDRKKDSKNSIDENGYWVYTGLGSTVRVGNHAVATPPVVATNAVTGVTESGATLSGDVTSDGNSPVTERGFVYDTTANPSLSKGTTVTAGAGTGSFTVPLSGLSPGVTYFVRAYATNGMGTTYGAEVSFTVKASPSTPPTSSSSSSSSTGTPPTVVTDNVTGVIASGATLSGEVTKKGGADVTERGFVYGTTANPSIGGTGIVKVKEGSGTGSFTSAVKGLTADTVYHVRAYAVNSAGTAYGADVKFVTTASTVPPAGEIGRLDASGIDLSSPYGNVVIYTDSSGEKHILGLGIVVGSEMRYVSRGTGDYAIVFNAKPFDDIAGHWAKNEVDFASARLLFTGVTPKLFSPDTPMTRGMLVAVLGRMYGADPARYTGRSFDDVSTGAYYAPYVKWAAENKIVLGMSETAFQPGRAVTRQEMAAIMDRFMDYLKLEPKAGNGASFTDMDRISGWAKDSAASLNNAGILTGRPGNQFDPMATSTRAETAAVLRRLVEYIVTQ